MEPFSPQVKFFINLATVQSQVTRRFDRGLGGLGLSEFIILHAISLAPAQRMSRVELAVKVGLTPSGVTRLLLPMEKIGLVKRENDPQDARISLVAMAPGGRRKLEESAERAELLAAELLPASAMKQLKAFSSLLSEMGGKIA